MLKYLSDLIFGKDEMRGVPLTAPYKEIRNLFEKFGINPLSIPAVANGTRLISENCAKLSVDVFIKDKYNSRDKDKKHRGSKIFRKPNTFQTWSRFMALLLQHAIIHGNGYSRLFFNSVGEITDAIPVDPREVEIVVENNQVWYAIKEHGVVKHVVPDWQMLHVKGLMASSYKGYSLIELMSNSFGYSEALNTYGFTYFKNGASVKTVLTMPEKLWANKEKREEFKKAWEETHNGVENAGKASFIVEGMKLDKLSMSNDESQYLSARENDLINVANILGVPAHYLGSKNATSHNSTVEEKQALLDFCLDPWLVNLEQEFESKFLKETEKEEETRYIEFNRKKFVGMNPQLEAQLLIAYYINGILSWEEVRAKLNESTYFDETLRWFLAANIMQQGNGQQIAQNAPGDTKAPIDGEIVDEKRGMAIATIERLGRRLERSNKPAIDHLQIFEQSLPHLKLECRDILEEAMELPKLEGIKLIREELCRIV